MSPTPRLAAIILAGGRGARFGGDKAVVVVDGETLVERVTRIAGEVASRVIVVGGRAQTLPELAAGVVVVRDAEPFAGPLAGLARGVEALGIDADAALVLAVDLPRLCMSTLRAVVRARPPDGSVIPVIADRPQPLFAAYARASLATVPELVADGTRSMMAFVAQTPHVTVTERSLLADPDVAADDPGLASFRDADTPGDLA